MRMYCLNTQNACYSHLTYFTFFNFFFQMGSFSHYLSWFYFLFSLLVGVVCFKEIKNWLFNVSLAYLFQQVFKIRQDYLPDF